jgi:hypothetical protein
MFQIQTSATRKGASALTVLAAMGASGMVAQVAPAAVTDVAPSAGARGKNSSYIGSGFPENWVNWLSDEAITYQAEGPAFATWAIDFGAGTIASAKYRIDANNAGASYGIPPGATLQFALVTEPWSAATPDSSNTGPDVGTTPGTQLLEIVSPGGDYDADITPLLLTWQSNPSAYYGVRFEVTSGTPRGGVHSPNDTFITAHLLLDQASAPEPASLSMLSLGALLGLRRRRR